MKFSYKNLNRLGGCVVEGTEYFRDPKQLTKAQKKRLAEDFAENKVKFAKFIDESELSVASNEESVCFIVLIQLVGRWINH